MTNKTMAWRLDTHDWAFHLAYDDADFDGTVSCFKAAQGNARIADGDVVGDAIMSDAAAHEAYVEILAQHQAINQQKAADRAAQKTGG